MGCTSTRGVSMRLGLRSRRLSVAVRSSNGKFSARGGAGKVKLRAVTRHVRSVGNAFRLVSRVGTNAGVMTGVSLT